MIALVFIIIYLVSFAINLIIYYQDNKRHIFNVGDCDFVSTERFNEDSKLFQYLNKIEHYIYYMGEILEFYEKEN